MRTQNTKKITVLAMLCAVAYIVVILAKMIPFGFFVSFLKYDPKDVIIVIGGFIYGPISALLISVVVSFIEMFTISETGWIGFAMNVLSTCAFACTASFLYKKKHDLKGAVLGLCFGVVLMVIVMLLWNYFLTPIYMGYDRAVVGAMLPTVFLPFNLIKGCANAAITMLLYKPIIGSLRKAHLLPTASVGGAKSKFSPGVVLISLLVLASCVFAILIINGTL